MSRFVQAVISQNELKLLGGVEKWITLILSGPGGRGLGGISEAWMTKLIAANQKPLTL